MWVTTRNTHSRRISRRSNGNNNNNNNSNSNSSNSNDNNDNNTDSEFETSPWALTPPPERSPSLSSQPPPRAKQKISRNKSIPTKKKTQKSFIAYESDFKEIVCYLRL